MANKRYYDWREREIEEDLARKEAEWAKEREREAQEEEQRRRAKKEDEKRKFWEKEMRRQTNEKKENRKVWDEANQIAQEARDRARNAEAEKGGEHLM